MNTINRFVIFFFLSFLLAQILSCKQGEMGSGTEIAYQKEPSRELQKKDVAEKNVSQRLSGIYLKAFLTAHDSFLKDKEIPENKKNLANYDVIFLNEKEFYIVTFQAKRTPEEERTLLGSESSLGKDTTFLINKSDFSLNKRAFYK